MSDEKKRMETHGMETALAPPKPGTIEVIPDAVDEAMAIVERRNAFLERYVPAAIAATEPSQWTKIGGQPWPGAAASEAMARRLGVSWDEPRAVRVPLPDDGGIPGYRWTYRARFYLPGNLDSAWAEGHCDSRDQFLGTGSDPEKPVRKLWEVVEGNIQQAAFSNLKVNGVCSLLGVRRMTTERLDRIFAAAGKGGTGAMGSAEFKSGARGGGQGQAGVGDVDLKFGRAFKEGGKTKLSQCTDDEIRWYVSMWRKDLGDESKAKYHAASKKSIETAEAILQGRQKPAGAEGTTPPSGMVAWDALCAMLPDQPKDAVAALVKRVTGVPSASKLTAADFLKVKEEIEKTKTPPTGGTPATNNDDVPGWPSGDSEPGSDG